jgi:hypothetical protein
VVSYRSVRMYATHATAKLVHACCMVRPSPALMYQGGCNDSVGAELSGTHRRPVCYAWERG